LKVPPLPFQFRIRRDEGKKESNADDPAGLLYLTGRYLEYLRCVTFPGKPCMRGANAKLETTSIYTHVAVNAIKEAHRRCHPARTAAQS
jgi:hypothetical protein